MADPGGTGATTPLEPASTAYRALMVSHLRAQTAYRASFAMDVAGSVLLGLTELAEVYVVFHNVHALGGLDVPAALIVFALANLGMALGEVLAGHLDEVSHHIRAGTLEVLLLRPIPLLAQLALGDITLRRLGRAGLAGAVLAFALARATVHWTPQLLGLLVITPIASALVFAALFVLAGAVQFWIVDGAELTNSFTYGTSYAASYVAAVLPLPLRLLFTFVVPATFTAYLPTLALLDLPQPPWLPAWLDWCGPAVAGLTWAAALRAWHLGVRRYTGAGG